MCYETAEGVVGEARGGIWASGQSGLLWFFDRDNAEVLVKVLDGCSHNGRRWIFVAPVTDVAFNLHVTSSGGREWTHRNPLGRTAETRSDTSAFVCATEDDATSTYAAASGPPETAPGLSVTASPIVRGEHTDCRPATTPLTFDGGYRVSLCYETAEGVVGEARAGIWASDQSGLLWFFSRGNAEVLVKVLDGCSHNGRRWIFVAPVTDVAFNLHVTSSGGREWTHRNPLGRTAVTRSDTSAFVCATDDGAPDDATPVDITDPTLRSAIRAELGLPSGTSITRDHLKGLTRLAANDAGIRDLEGLEAATNLTFLELQGNEITDVSALAGLVNLSWLKLASNRISDVAPLAGLTRLKVLELAYNGLGSQAVGISNVAPLAGLTGLTHLTLDYNRVSDLAPLAGLTNLNNLYVQVNKITDVAPLAGLTNLTGLYLADNEIGDVGPLAGLTKLSWLHLQDNGIADVAPLAGLTNLKNLDLGFNEIASVAPLAALADLTDLRLAYNRISDVAPLAGLTNLSALDARFNQIADVAPLARLPSLSALDLRGNPLDPASLDLHVPGLLRRGVEVQFDRFTKGEFDIELVFLDERWSGGRGQTHRQVVEWAVRRWTAIVSNDLADHVFSQAESGRCGEGSWEISAGERVDDLRVYVTSFEGDPEDPVGYAGQALLRDSGFPVVGCMAIDLDRANVDVTASHELGHVLGIGIGPLWGDFLQTSTDPHFNGPLAIAAFDDAGGTSYVGAKVPLAEPTHWRVPILDHELMGPHGGHALSAITVQALADLGYQVNLDQADEYSLSGAGAAGGASAHGAAQAPFCGVRGTSKPIPVVGR
ncbi:MAG: leucine-rich repeat domain-containing protein [Acidobacteria bacterium]|nr:leucine-rich repeat domain-containing protein [Acidobacteriota bacterium]